MWNDGFRSKSHDGVFDGDLEEERMKHQKICRLVQYVDEFISLHKAGSFFFNIGSLLCLMYQLLWSEETTGSVWGIITTAFWLFSHLLNLGITCITGAYVHNAVSYVLY